VPRTELARALKDVPISDAGRADSNEDLARSRLWSGQFEDLQFVEAAEALDCRGLHHFSFFV
jgi:hypothetical protein